MHETVYQHISDDTPFRLTSNNELSHTRIVQTGSSIGRVLFTEHSPAVIANGNDIAIHDCIFEIQSTALLIGSRHA